MTALASKMGLTASPVVSQPEMTPLSLESLKDI